MIKIGITRMGPRAARALKLEELRRGWWPFAYSLLADLEQSSIVENEAMLDRLYRSLAGGESAVKITRRGRFAELDRELVSEIKRRFGTVRPIAVHDAAASNAITSLELYRALSETCQIHLFASDWYDSIWIVGSETDYYKVVFDAEFRPIQVIWGVFVFSCGSLYSWRYPVNRLLQAIVVKRVIGKAAKQLRHNADGIANATAVRRVRLFHPSCIRVAEEDRNFRLLRDNLLNPIQRQYDVVRVMNALTPRHMSSERVRQGICASAANVVNGGLFVLGRSPEEKDDCTRVTVYEKSGGSLRQLWSLNGGYEWPELVPTAS